MNVKHIRKVKGLYEVIFDVDTIKYHEEVIIKYNLLKTNIDLSEDVYNLTLLDNRYFLCRDKALKYLVNLKFISTVKDYLLRSEEWFVVNRVIDNLIENKILDDYITACNYVESKYSKGYGNVELSKKLNDLKVESTIITKVLLEYREFEIECLNKYCTKLINTVKSLNNRDLKKKVEQRLVVHGYNFSDIKDVLSSYNESINDVVYNSDVIDKQFEKALKKYIDESDKYIQEKKIINYLMYKGFDLNEIKNKVDMWKIGE